MFANSDFIEDLGLGPRINLRSLPDAERLYRNFLVGYLGKEVVSLLLDQARYEVYPYGFESFLPALKRRLYEQESTPTAERVRYTPDLLVRDPARPGWLRYVEVKTRNWPIYDPIAWSDDELYTDDEREELPRIYQDNLGWVGLGSGASRRFHDFFNRIKMLDAKGLGVPQYRRYWPESILVLVVPTGAILYAISVDDLPDEIEVLEPGHHLKPIGEVFPRLKRWPIRKRFLGYIVTRLLEGL